MAEQPGKPTLKSDEIEQLVKQDRDQRAQMCGAAVKQILQEYHCTIEVSMTLRDNAVYSNVDIIAH